MAYFRCGGGLPTQTKSTTATTSQQTVTPDSGYVLESVIVDPQSHSSYYPSSSSYYDVDGTTTINLGANHNYRYIRVNGTHSLSETLLWTNTSSAQTFSSEITLSQSVYNFTYLRIDSYGYKSTTGTGTSAYANSRRVTALFKTSDLVNESIESIPDGTPYQGLSIGYNINNTPSGAGHVLAARPITLRSYNNSDGKILTVGVCYVGSEIKNQYCIPYKIYGLN